MPAVFKLIVMFILASANTGLRDVSEETGQGHFIYFVGRASVQKSSLIASSFNLRDTLISHVGIGIAEKNEMLIYHVEDRRGNALAVHNLQQFISPGIFYFSVYAIPVSKEEAAKLTSVLKSFNTVQFDSDLCLENNSLYCSEFCLRVLSSVDSEKFAFEPVTKNISHPFIRSYLSRDTVTYIPVDFFLSYRGIIKIREQSLSFQ